MKTDKRIKLPKRCHTSELRRRRGARTAMKIVDVIATMNVHGLKLDAAHIKAVTTKPTEIVRDGP